MAFVLGCVCAQSGEPFDIATQWRERSPVTALCWAPKKSWVATLQRDGAVTVRNAKDGKVVQRLQGRETEHGAIAFSPKGNWLAVGGLDVVRVWSTTGKWKLVAELDLLAVDEEEEEYVPITATISDVAALQFLAGGKQLLVAGDAPVIEIWETRKWQRDGRIYDRTKPLGKIDGDVTAIAVSKRGRAIAAAGRLPRVAYWTKKQGRWSARSAVDDQAKYPEHEGSDLAASPDGRTLAVGGAQRSGRLLLLDGWSGKLLFDHPVKASYVPTVAWSKDGSQVMVASIDFVAWDAKKGEKVREFALPAVALMMRRSPDGARLAISFADGAVIAYRLQP